MAGYLIGLGDRHPDNILLNTKTWETILIDFGVVFDSGQNLPIPEIVPFRLTEELRDSMGIY